MHPANDLRGSKGNDLAGKRIVLAVTGSIAAVETVRLARELIRFGADVIPVMSPAATGIIHPDALWFATGNKPITRLGGDVEHVTYCGDVPDRVDLLLICPATANTISKTALGIDDTPVTTFATTAIGSGIPVMVVPAMHGSMYGHPAVIEHISKLSELGITVVDPRMEEKKAKVADIDRVVVEVRRRLSPGVLFGRRVTVIYGGTKEPIDDVRYIGNASSGMTGAAICREAYIQGADVEVWRSDTGASHNLPVDEHIFVTHDDLLKAGENITGDLTIIPAAISDFGVAPAKGKMDSGTPVELRLEPLEKILPGISTKIVAFKAVSGVSDGEMLRRAKALLSEKVLLVVANDVSNAGRSHGRYAFVSDGDAVWYEGSKEGMARELLRRAATCLEE